MHTSFFLPTDTRGCFVKPPYRGGFAKPLGVSQSPHTEGLCQTHEQRWLLKDPRDFVHTEGALCTYVGGGSSFQIILLGMAWSVLICIEKSCFYPLTQWRWRWGSCTKFIVRNCMECANMQMKIMFLIPNANGGGGQVPNFACQELNEMSTSANKNHISHPHLMGIWIEGGMSSMKVHILGVAWICISAKKNCFKGYPVECRFKWSLKTWLFLFRSANFMWIIAIKIFTGSTAHSNSMRGRSVSSFFCVGLYIPCNSKQKKVLDFTPTPNPTPWGWSENHDFLCSSSHFMQFLAKIILWYLTYQSTLWTGS